MIRSILTPTIADYHILHVGNIAQNAYWNAQTLNTAGYQSDVLIHDLYHFASSPRWLSLSKSGIKRNQLEDDYYPNFFAFPDTASEDPNFVAQGPLHSAAGLLILRRTGASPGTISAARDSLTYWRFKATVLRTASIWSEWWTDQEFERVLCDWNLAAEYLPSLRAGRQAERLQLKLNTLLELVHGSTIAQGASHFLDQNYVDELFKAYAQLSGCSSISMLPKSNDTHKFVLDLHAHITLMRRSRLTVAYTAELISPDVPEKIPSQPLVTEDDTGWFVGVYSLWRKLFECYRYRFTYSNACIFSNLSGAYPYAAYEHGTIRELPFQDHQMGRLTKAGYLNATSVLITNADYAIADSKLEFPNGVATYCPHGFDHDKANLFLQQEIADRKKSGEIIRFTAPARHTWNEDDPGNEKGNDVIIYAIAAAKEVVGNCFKVTFIDYGLSVEKTKHLIAKLKVEDMCEWISPLPTSDLWDLYKRSNAIIDQFSIPAIGAIGVEALALGCRLISRDEGALRLFFGETPPMYAASTPKEVSDAMIKVVKDPNDFNEMGMKAREWFQRYHGPTAVVDAFAVAMEKIDHEYATNKSINSHSSHSIWSRVRSLFATS